MVNNNSKAEKIKNFDPNGVGLKNGHFIGLPFEEADASIVLLPVPWDVTVSYGAGTATGAANILEGSPQLDLFDPDVPDAWKMGLFMRPPEEAWLRRSQELRPGAARYIEQLEEGRPVDQDTLQQINSACAELKAWVKKETTALLEQGKAVGLVGGEHSVPLGFLETLAERHPGFGILQIDAHMDLREAYEGFTYSHASIFYNALQLEGVTQLTQVGIRDYCEAEYRLAQSDKRCTVFFNHDLQQQAFEGTSWGRLCQKIISTLPQAVYISFDIDGLLPELCPNTGTPVPGGLTFDEAIFLLRQVVESGRTIIGFDLCETAGFPHEWDANVGARILYKLANLMGRSQQLKTT
ncbi:MAG: agmatinase family protein [Phaeodactylibacter sp.]|uniref:agmatinase family protein n=1 Tax=Phaeodactylibacter sp. TaxID=1940289 RepID=UPI0032EFE6C3